MGDHQLLIEAEDLRTPEQKDEELVHEHEAFDAKVWW
jgi:hypothetical protein